jgi:hypothetical protein
MAWFNRLANSLRPDKLRGEIDEELRYHIEARIADNLAGGMNAKEAHADAVRHFGAMPSPLTNPAMPTYSSGWKRRFKTFDTAPATYARIPG